MARKSREKRIQDTQSTIELWKEVGLSNDRRVTFMSDMVRRLSSGRGISKKQREWLDSLHADGPPELKGDSAMVDKIDTAIKVLSKDTRSVEALTSFRGQVHQGRKLSDKQEKFLSILLAKSDHIQDHGYYKPTSEQLEDLRIALAVCRARIQWIGQNKPGTYKAYEKVNSWMVAEDLLAKGAIEENLFIIDEWVVNKVLHAGKVAIREIKSPKHPPGSMRYVWHRKEQKLCLVASGPSVDGPGFQGQVQYECLVDGEVIWVHTESLKKRRSKK